MLKVLHIRRNPTGGNDGTANYCQGLYDMLRDCADVKVLPVEDIPQKSSLFKYTYDDAVLSDYIAKADIVHINGYTAMGTRKAIKLAKHMGKKVVYTAHWHPFEYLNHPWLGKLFFYLFLAPVIKKHVDVVTAINSEDEEFFSKIHNKVVRIPHWNNSTSAHTTPATKNRRMILFVGRLNDPVKGIEHLLAIPENKYEIHCVGGGTLPTNRKDFYQHINLSTEELTQLYQKASLVVIPSKYEAFSFVALESLVNGTPVLMSERVRIKDYLNSVSGYDVFNYGDMNDFATKIDTTINLHVEVEKVKEIFDIRNIKEKYIRLYKSLF